MRAMLRVEKQDTYFRHIMPCDIDVAAGGLRTGGMRQRYWLVDLECALLMDTF